MKKFTQEDFDAFEVGKDGYRICPSGDYSAMKNFGDCCIFGEDCVFGERCIFGDGCSFGYDCIFGAYCSFGKNCSFGEDFGFSEHCIFGAGCIFGAYCSFGEECSFGMHCSFDEGCRFGMGCLVENGKQLLDFLKFEGFGSEKRCTYFYLVDDKQIYVRCGCFAGYLDGFRKKVMERHGDSKLAQGYLKIADLAQWQFLEEGGNGR